MIKTCLTQSEDVIWRRIGDEIVVIKDNGQSSHVLNKTAVFIWDMFDGNNGIDEIATRLSEHFDISFEEARTDTKDIIKTFAKIGITKHNRKLSRN